MNRSRVLWLLPLVLQVACEMKSPTDRDGSGMDDTGGEEATGPGSEEESTGPEEDTGEAPTDSDDANDQEDHSVDEEFDGDTGQANGLEDEVPFEPTWPVGTDPFADEVVTFEPGPDAGFGMDVFPDIVLGSPEGRGSGSGSLDVLSLGEEGQIVLAFTDLEMIDGPGPDLLVFENPFGTWFETAFVEASLDGVEWVHWPCDPEDVDGDYPGCAGVGYVFANSGASGDPTDPAFAGGDAFDLSDIGLPSARYVRITDSGYNALGYGGTSGGFDLDAIAVANWEPISDGE